MAKTAIHGATFDEVAGWPDEFQAMWRQAGRSVRRRDTRDRIEQYMRGLLGRVERKNGWQLAEYLGEDAPYAIQNTIGRADWDADRIRDELRGYAAGRLLAPGESGVLVVDETGFLKHGENSVGVQRQYSGTAGKIDNCQLGVFLALVGSRGRALIDRELYLPQAWCDDDSRCRAAKVPPGTKFATKPQLAVRMLARTLDGGLAPAWVLADEVYGNDPKFRRFLEGWKQPYAVAVGKLHRAEIEGREMRLDAAAKKVSPENWIRLSVGDGLKGPRLFDWAAVAVDAPVEDGLRRWVLFRRSVGRPEELAYYRCLAPEDAALRELAEAAGQRWSIECCFEAAKQETGLDEYEVRSWHGWYRHVTLSMYALAFLAAIRAAAADSDGPVKKTSRRWCR
jgi:SRSO17 transposase